MRPGDFSQIPLKVGACVNRGRAQLESKIGAGSVYELRVGEEVVRVGYTAVESASPEHDVVADVDVGRRNVRLHLDQKSEL
jgi:hypothetical protein